jgi:serine/threonine protein kinase
MNFSLPSRKSPLANSIKDFQIEKQIGQGAFGQVFKARLRSQPKTIYAIKKVNSKILDQTSSIKHKR